MLNCFKPGIAGAEFEVAAERFPDVKEFVSSQINHYWDRGVPKVQGGYDYGWIGCENLYTDEDGPLRWAGMRDFSPRDTFLLTQDHAPVGVRVKNVPDRGPVDLWLGTRDVPGKAVWYAHQPRFNAFYGITQLCSACGGRGAATAGRTARRPSWTGASTGSRTPGRSAATRKKTCRRRSRGCRGRRRTRRAAHGGTPAT